MGNPHYASALIHGKNSFPHKRDRAETRNPAACADSVRSLQARFRLEHIGKNNVPHPACKRKGSFAGTVFRSLGFLGVGL